MAKISKALLSVLCGSNLATTVFDSYNTTSCNDNDNNPALTFTIKKDYFEEYYQGETGYTLRTTPTGDVYERTITQDQLTVDWSDPENLGLTYTISPSSDGHSIGGVEFIKFSEESVEFKCLYPRGITTDSDFTVRTHFQEQPILYSGTLSYSLSIDSPPIVGLDATMTITGKHSLTGVSAEVKECFITEVPDDSSDANPGRDIFLVHSFDPAGTCFNNQLGTTQISSDPMQIAYKTFRFTTNGTLGDNTTQGQKVSCKLHLVPTASVQPTPSDCTCITRAACDECDVGYAPNNGLCEDFNECTENTHRCDGNATCSNTTGGHTCACNAGFSGDGASCTNDNECADNTDDCDVNASCTDTEGSYNCDCNDGYSGDGTTCSNDDECADNTHDCDGNASCTDTEGSYICDCNTGFSGDGANCTNDNECADNTHDCDGNASCTDTEGSYVCDCNDGYSGTGTKFTCSNDDECAENFHDCDANASCTDTIGSYTCKCDAGYSGDGFNCSNDNECTDNTDNCDANASCTDTEGSFTCSCNDGYSGDGISCNALLVWHGDASIATMENTGGTCCSANPPGIEAMFDDEPHTTFLHTHHNHRNGIRRIGATFNGEIIFHSLTIGKSGYMAPDYGGSGDYGSGDLVFQADNRHQNVCLVLDDDETNQLCTDHVAGFSDNIGPTITWEVDPIRVRKVYLYFRSTGPHYGYSIIADWKIIYEPAV